MANPAGVSTIPKPPDLYNVRRYILTNKFVGRVSELHQLDVWAQSAYPLLVIEAIGGMGKSALAWEWINNPEHAPKAIPGLAGIFWWNFYECGATMQAFIRHALAYITGKNPDDPELKQMSYEERANRLLIELSHAPYLFVLDGLERLLLAYHRWDAPQMREDLLNDSSASRACTEPQDANCLQLLTTIAPAKLLITSRLMPIALEEEHHPGVQLMSLTGLNLDAAADLMQICGVNEADRPTLDAFMTSIGCHSLSLKMIAVCVKNDAIAPGNFDMWYAEQGSQLGLTGMDIEQNQSRVLQHTFDNLAAEKRKLLGQIAAFNDAISYDMLSLFNPYLPPKPPEMKRPQPSVTFTPFMIGGAQTAEEHAKYQKQFDDERTAYAAKHPEEKAAYEAYLKTLDDRLKSAEYSAGVAAFDKTLTELVERGLLEWDREQDRCDLHPVVRGYGFGLLQQEDKLQTFERIHDYLRARPLEDVKKAVEIEDLNNTIEIYRALVGAGKYDAAAVWYLRLRNVLEDNLTFNRKALELLMPLFRDGIDKLPALKEVGFRSVATSHLATILHNLGRTDDALVLMRLQMKLALDYKEVYRLVYGLHVYSRLLAANNQLAAALQTNQLALTVATADDNSDQQAVSHLVLLDLYKDMGDWAAAESAYAAFNATPDYEGYGQDKAYYAYTLMNFYRGQEVSDMLDEIERYVKEDSRTLPVRDIRALHAEIALSAGRWDEAADQFQMAVTLALKVGLSGDDYRGGLARARVAQGHTDEARRLVAKGVHDIDAAEVFLALGDTASSKDYALKAYKSAWADGAPYCFWWNLERSKKVLDTLGEPYPDMPPFDPVKVEPIPYDTEIRALIAELEAKKAAKELEEAAEENEDTGGES